MNPNEIADIIDKRVKRATEKAFNKMYKRGIVASASGRYADVRIEGNSVATKGIPVLGNYNPVVGDKVLILSIGDTGTNLIIMGPIYASAPGS